MVIVRLKHYMSEYYSKMRKKERLSEEDADLSCQAPDLPELSQSAGGGREALRWPPPKARRVTIIAVIVSDGANT